MDSLADIKEELEKNFKCRYYPFNLCCDISFIETGEWSDDTEIMVINLFITKHHNAIKLIKNNQHIKFCLSDFLNRIKQELMTSLRSNIMGHYKEYIIIRE